MEAKVCTLFQPNDKKDVPLAYLLLVTIITLPEACEGGTTIYFETCRALNVLGQLFSAILEPYTNPKFCLHEQLISLSKAAHMTIALFVASKVNLMPIQLYSDIMHMIKNVYFCIAKTKLDNPDGSFHLILLGIGLKFNLEFCIQ
jgi:hypothetical protein